MGSVQNQASHTRRTLGFLLRDSSRLMRRRFVLHAREAELPLNLSEASLLSQVSHEPGISQARVANLPDMETISVVRLVDSLEQANLLQRRPHASDRRVWTLWLTSAGESAVTDIRRINDKVRSEALAEISSGERERLLDTLMKLRTNLLHAAEHGHSEAA